MKIFLLKGLYKACARGRLGFQRALQRTSGGPLAIKRKIGSAEKDLQGLLQDDVEKAH